MNDDRPCVLVLMGGPDAEREVSLASGAAVAAALAASGEFRVRDATIDRLASDDLPALAPPGAVDVIFPVLHGTWGEGGGLQTLLETHGIPFVGSGAEAAALAMDKVRTKERAAALGVPTPDARVIEAGDACELAPPLVLKPVDDGSSVDLRICRTVCEVQAARDVLHPRRGRLLAERYVAGRELTVAIRAGAALPIIEIVPAVEFYDYAAKYERDDTRYVIDPDLPPGVAGRCRADALLINETLGCRDLARVDFMLDDAGPWFLELNTMPGFTDHSLLPMAARATGVAMPALCAGLARAALARGAHPMSAPAGCIAPR